MKKLLIILIGILLTIVSCDYVKTSAGSIYNIAKAAWLTNGNSMLIFASDSIQTGVISIDLEKEEYPFNIEHDGAFFNMAALNKHTKFSDIKSFDFLCGRSENENAPLVTKLVFWSKDYWEGTKQEFTCDNSSEYKISSALKTSLSFCVVTNNTDGKRYSRCVNGPRCDDEMANGNESDVDCGGVCPDKCKEGQTCKLGRDCKGGYCEDGICITPPSCTDGIKNQGESDIDCGGPCKDCENGERCDGNDYNCKSRNCVGNTCQAKPTCNGTPETSSAKGWVVVAENSNTKCLYTVTYFANNFSDAKECAKSEGHNVPNTLCDYYILFHGGWSGGQSLSARRGNAEKCAANYCGNCTFTVTEIQCYSQ